MKKRLVENDLFTLSSGDYSDYCVRGLFRALVNFYPMDHKWRGLPSLEEVEQYRQELVEHSNEWTIDYHRERLYGSDGQRSEYHAEALRDAILDRDSGFQRQAGRFMLQFSWDRWAANMVRWGYIEEVDYTEFHESDFRLEED